jgi:hypothetical protein
VLVTSTGETLPQEAVSTGNVQSWPPLARARLSRCIRGGKYQELAIVKSPGWKQFETAVAQFIAALDPQAVVQHNVRLPDVHTGHPRQRDVWVEAKVCQLFPVKVLISCKRWQTKLDEQDVDAFVGELYSSAAHKGVIYSYSGFTEPAIEKAKRLGICCCCLYANRPPDLPQMLIFHSYCCTPRISLTLLEAPKTEWSLKKFDDLFALKIIGPNGPTTALDYIAGIYYQGEEEIAKSTISQRQFPADWKTEIEIPDLEYTRPPLRIRVNGSWNYYRGKLEAHLCEGTYSFTSGEFKGQQIGPAVDMQGPSPGPGWEHLEEKPSKIEPNFVLTILLHGNVKEALQQHLGPKSLANSA